MFDSLHKSKDVDMLEGIHKLLDEADVVVHYNGIKFDIPTLNKEFIKHDMTPPAPYKQIDLLRVARREFRFQSNKLGYVAEHLGVGQKVKHEGFKLWVDCMNGDDKAWRKMEKYNKGDVIVLEGVYEKMLPWIRNHPNVGLYDKNASCTSCGSNKYQQRGVARTKTVTYQRYQCSDCGTWFKGEKVKSNKVKFTGVS